MKSKDLLLIGGIGIVAYMMIPKSKEPDDGGGIIALPAETSFDIGGLMSGLTGILGTQKDGGGSYIEPVTGGGAVQTIIDLIKGIIPEDVGEGLIPDIPDIPEVITDIIDDLIPDIPDIFQPIKDIEIRLPSIDIDLPDINIDTPKLTVGGQSAWDFYINHILLGGLLSFDGEQTPAEIETTAPSETTVEQMFTPEQIAYGEEQAKRWEVEE